jgi:hypothetical protein
MHYELQKSVKEIKAGTKNKKQQTKALKSNTITF